MGWEHGVISWFLAARCNGSKTCRMAWLRPTNQPTRLRLLQNATLFRFGTNLGPEFLDQGCTRLLSLRRLHGASAIDELI